MCVYIVNIKLVYEPKQAINNSIQTHAYLLKG